jgi:hypothetical protein
MATRASSGSISFLIPFPEGTAEEDMVYKCKEIAIDLNKVLDKYGAKTISIAEFMKLAEGVESGKIDAYSSGHFDRDTKEVEIDKNYKFDKGEHL